jgi:hypothetical protein
MTFWRKIAARANRVYLNRKTGPLTGFSFVHFPFRGRRSATARRVSWPCLASFVRRVAAGKMMRPEDWGHF